LIDKVGLTGVKHEKEEKLQITELGTSGKTSDKSISDN
jgi:hypothetical protein